ncbi:non-homologous end-joining DNA ligase [bacterium]|nr:non-homologous end-joining DNA ligase [bacterium]
MKIDGHEIEVQHLDKVFFPEVNLTKGDLMDYYEAVSDVMVPHMKRYPVSMQRFPDGLKGKGFYNKDMPDYFPDWIKTVNFPKREGGSFNAPIVDSKASLMFLADQAVVTPHLYLSRADDLEHPDKMIFDLDPPEDTRDYALVRQAALDIRDVMGELDLKAWVQTTGSQGFHVVIPLDRSEDFDSVRAFAQDVARILIRRKEDTYTLEDRIKARKGRIFLDTLRNSYGATAVAPYAVRGKPSASVATPVDWQEVEDGVNPRDWTIENLQNRLAQKEDPWKGMMRHAQSLQSRKDKLQKILDAEPKAEEEE